MSVTVPRPRNSSGDPEGPAAGNRRRIPRRSADRHLRMGVVITLVDAMALHDAATARHAAAVARQARALAGRIGCSADEQRLVHTAGLLHDIGKFALSDAVLRGSALSERDQRVVRGLPEASAALVGRLEGYGRVAEIILYHHERVDGMGYPAGLIAHEIPLPSRVLAVANVYDALTSRHSYRGPVSEADSVRELRRVAGTQLDADLVASFVGLLADDPFTSDQLDYQAELDVERRAWALDAA